MEGGRERKGGVKKVLFEVTVAVNQPLQSSDA